MRNVLLALVTAASLGLATPARAATIDFESFSDLDALTTQVSGLVFNDFTILTSGAMGGSLNEFDYPPRSGNNVAAGLNGSSSISFTSAISSFSGFFTYDGTLSLAFYDGATLLQTITSAFAANYASSANAPNELLQFSAANITQVIITGGLFVVDDLSYTVANGGTPPVPEPASVVLLLTGLAALGYRNRSRLRFLPQH